MEADGTDGLSEEDLVELCQGGGEFMTFPEWIHRLGINLSLFLSILTAIFPGEPVLASFIEAKDDGSGSDKSCKSFSQIFATNKLTPNILQVEFPCCRPTNSVKVLKGKMSHFVDLLTRSSPGGFPTSSFTTNSSWLPWGTGIRGLVRGMATLPQGNQESGNKWKRKTMVNWHTQVHLE